MFDDVVGRGERFQPAPVQRVPDRDQQTVGGERLDDEIVGALAHRLDRGVDRAVRGDDDDRGGQAALADRAQDLDAVHVRQFEVEQHDIGRRRRARQAPARRCRRRATRCPAASRPRDRGAELTGCPRPAAAALSPSFAFLQHAARYVPGSWFQMTEYRRRVYKSGRASRKGRAAERYVARRPARAAAPEPALPPARRARGAAVLAAVGDLAVRRALGRADRRHRAAAVGERAGGDSRRGAQAHLEPGARLRGAHPPHGQGNRPDAAWC